MVSITVVVQYRIYFCIRYGGLCFVYKWEHLAFTGRVGRCAELSLLIPLISVVRSELLFSPLNLHHKLVRWIPSLPVSQLKKPRLKRSSILSGDHLARE